MSTIYEITAREMVLKTEFVDSDYFLLRVKHFEQQYNQSWGQFFGEYTSGRLDLDRKNPDYIEWAFLCRTFLSELIKEEDGESPPGQVTSVFPEKPEIDSGFCFWAMPLPRNVDVRCRGIHHAGAEPSPVVPECTPCGFSRA